MKRQQGVALIEAALVLAVLGIIGFVGYKVLNGKSGPHGNQTQANQQNASPHVSWSYDPQAQEYLARGNPPKCPEPYKFANSPIDLGQATSIMLPGQWRSFGYKPHGGFRLDNSQTGSVEVKLPMDAKLVNMTRYLEGKADEVQYMVEFESDCGIAVRFDHLYKLTPKFQAIAETLPAPKKDDSRSQPLKDQPYFKTGETVAESIGLPSNKNFGFDFGVYDFRQRNKVSQSNAKWAEIHKTEAQKAWFGICWLDMLPGKDAAKANQLAKVVVNPSKPDIISDYCDIAPHTTMEYNGGQAPAGTYN